MLMADEVTHLMERRALTLAERRGLWNATHPPLGGVVELLDGRLCAVNLYEPSNRRQYR